MSADGTLEVVTGGRQDRASRTRDSLPAIKGRAEAPATLVLTRNGLHVAIVVSADHPIGRTDKAHIADVVLESAVTTIMDCEDSVAAVDAEDKTLVYRNWLGLMKGDLVERFEKGGQIITRKLNPDQPYTGPDGSERLLRARSLMLVRNVGHLMTSPAIRDRGGARGAGRHHGRDDHGARPRCTTSGRTGAVSIRRPARSTS